MPPFRPSVNFHLRPRKQRGAVLMIMLVIMVLGAATYLVSSLSTTALKNARQEKTAAALAQAKEALIGRAIKDASRPGSLPCPDLITNIAGTNVPNDGIADLLSGNDCPSYVGRLPWKTLGLPDLRDGDGERLWYALSSSVRDDNSAQPINSDTQGLLSITGNISLNNVAAIVFAPGAPLCGKSHATNNVDQYLEAMSSVTATTAVVNTNSNDCNNTPYNDNLLAITADQIFQPVEKRIAREVKRCLDDYAARPSLTIPSQPHGKYPWSVPLTDTTNYLAVSNTIFGRIPKYLTTNPNIIAILNAIAALQIAVNNCADTNTTAHINALGAAGSALENTATTIRNNQPTVPPVSSTITSPAIAAGDIAQDNESCNNIHTDPTSNSVQTNLNTANSALSSLSFPDDASMPISWPAICTTLYSSSYWPYWKELVFYQVAYGYRPGATTPLNCGATCLSVTGTGNSSAGSGTYRAVVVVAGKKLGANRIPSNAADYLETENLLPQGNSAKPYTTYRPTDPAYQSVNDLALCIDGNVNCK